LNKRLTRIIFRIGILLVFALSIQQIAGFYQKTETSRFYPVTNYLDFFSAGKEVTKVRPSVVPGGQSIGVTLQTKGVLVVGYAPITNKEGKQSYPAKDSGIEIGDIIFKINGITAINDFQVAQEIDKKCKENQTIVLEIKHKGKVLEKRIQPVFCSETQRYRIGLFIRDEAAGVGTLTFSEPNTKIFGALGHVITDIDTNDQIELSDGKIVESTIYSIEKGQKGDPGEKIGTFMVQSNFSGKITKNSASGIFGIYEGELRNPYFSTMVPIAWKSEVEVGPAKIYTVLKDNTIEEFDIKIEKIMQYRTDNKNMIIRITDPELLEKTGGIVQGMSGSPIIQNGKIVGAVTHVFVNDSTRGYGIFIEKMIDESGITSKAAAARKGGSSLTK
jgi:stage IV sporulation protein B